MINIKKILRIRNPDTGKFEPLLAIKGEKGDQPPLSNEFGNSETTAASQKLVTDEVGKLQEQVASNTDNISDLIQQVGNHANSITGMLKMTQGTYTGSGTNTKSLTFDFTPFFVYVSRSTSKVLDDSSIIASENVIWITNRNKVAWNNTSSSGDVFDRIEFTLAENTLRWTGYTTSSYARVLYRNALNSEDVTYTYFALGV